MGERGALEKLSILAYDTPNYEGEPVDQFDAMVNPSEVTHSLEIEYNSASGAGTTGSRMDFKNLKPGELTFALFLDGTGAGGEPVDVQERIEVFKRVTLYSGEIHRTHYLKLVWGTLPVVRCVLKSVSVAYKLFKPDGVPLRAVITATFIESIDDATRVARAQDKSADLTHRRVMKAGDSLPVLCDEIYGNASLYLRVAQANGLNTFRDIAPGTAILFPPLRK